MLAKFRVMVCIFSNVIIFTNSRWDARKNFIFQYMNMDGVIARNCFANVFQHFTFVHRDKGPSRACFYLFKRRPKIERSGLFNVLHKLENQLKVRLRRKKGTFKSVYFKECQINAVRLLTSPFYTQRANYTMEGLLPSTKRKAL